MIRGLIYEKFLSLCQPVVLGGLWNPFALSMDLWKTPADPSSIVEALRKQFGDAALREAHIVGSKGKHAGQLNPLLHDPRSIVLAFRGTPKEPPFNLAVERGCLSGETAICAALNDHVLSRSAVKNGYLALAFSMEDVAALRMVGMPAVPVGDLAHVRRTALKTFCRCLGELHSPASFSEAAPTLGPAGEDFARVLQADSGAENEPATQLGPHLADSEVVEGPIELMIVAWSPAELKLDEPEGLAELRLHLAAIEQHIQVPMQDVYVWRPAPADLERLAFCLRNATRKEVREALLASMDGCREPISLDRHQHVPPKDLPEALVRLQQAIDHSGDGEHYRDKLAWSEYEEKVNAELTAPLMGLASATAEPLQRNLLAAAASISPLLHSQTMLTCAKLKERIQKVKADKVGSEIGRDIQTVLELTRRLIDIHSELRQCQSKGKTSRFRS
jgi:hypothetical protein